MSGLRILLSLRFKIIGLMVVSLIACVSTVILLGTALFIDDKGSYLMEHNLLQVRAASDSVENQIQKTLMMTGLIHSQIKDSNFKGIYKIFEDYTKTIKLRRLLVLSVTKEGLLKTVAALGDEDRSLVHNLDQLGWDGQRFFNDQILLGKASSGELALGTFIRFPEGGGTAYLCLLNPELNLAEHHPPYYSLFLVDSLGDPLFAIQGQSSSIKRSQLIDLLRPTLDDKVTSGVRKWSSDREEYLVAYQRLKFKEFTVIGLVSETVAFVSVQGLLLRSVILGSSFLLISIGFAMIFLRRITLGLQAMLGITEKVREGDFTFRLDTKEMRDDEIGALATSFNLMAGKIDELVYESGRQIELRYEREVSNLAHGNFFPSLPLNLSRFNFSGKSIFSEACGGDWWHYEQVRDYVVLIVGKVDGSGVVAGMLTGVIKGAISTLCNSTRMMTMEVPDLKSIVVQLNTTLYGVTLGKQRFSCVLAVLDTRTGRMEVVNAAHPVPYLYRVKSEQELEEKSSTRSSRFSEQFRPIEMKKHSLLGAAPTIRVEVGSFQLKPGDLIFWHTSGLLRTLNGKGESLSSEKIFELIAELYEHSEGQAMQIASHLIENLGNFFGEVIQTLSDDITIVVATVPKKAVFEESEEAS